MILDEYINGKIKEIEDFLFDLTDSYGLKPYVKKHKIIKNDMTRGSCSFIIGIEEIDSDDFNANLCFSDIKMISKYLRYSHSIISDTSALEVINGFVLVISMEDLRRDAGANLFKSAIGLKKYNI